MLSMRDAESLYIDIKREEHTENMLTEVNQDILRYKIPELEFTSSPTVNEPDMLHLPEARSNAVKARANEQKENWEDQLKMMLLVAKIIRSEVEL